MCGIAGYWLREAPANDDLIRAAVDAQRHRGPDSRGYLLHGHVAVGMCRLAIIDLAGGDQPLYNEDHTVAVVCNGEIYNYKSLRGELLGRGHRLRSSSDVEVVAHLYEEEDAAFPRRLQGMLAVALVDRRRERVLLARDRFGKKPLYYSLADRGLIFASELKGLRAIANELAWPLEVSHQAIYDYLSFGVIPQPGTIFEGVRCVPPATCLAYDGHQLVSEAYWSPEELLPSSPQPSYADAATRVRELVGEAVQTRLQSEVPLGVFLSGGVDSAIVTLEASRRYEGPLHTFTISVADADLDETAAAAQTARALGVRNQALPIRLAPQDLFDLAVAQYDQPFADPSALPSLAVAREAKSRATVVLNGDGGDEVFAGYRRYRAARCLDQVPGLALRAAAALGGRAGSSLRRRSWGGFTARFLRGAAQDDATRYLVWTTDLLLESEKRAIWRGAPCRPTEESLGQMVPDRGTALRKQLYLDRRINLLSDLLVKMDIATMAFSVEARSPFLDPALFEYVRGLPDSYVVRGTRGKSLLRDAYRGLLPAHLERSPKRGFEVPLERWLAGEWREPLREALGSRDSRLRTWLAGDFLDGLLARPESHRGNTSFLRYALLVLEHWLRAQDQAKRSCEDSRPCA